MIVAFDNTMLSLILNPNGSPPIDTASGKPLHEIKSRTDSVIQKIKTGRGKIILPAPALAEIMTVIGSRSQEYIDKIEQGRIFEIGNFDARCAVELAELNRSVFSATDRKSKNVPYQKIKVDRQIIAICKVNGVTEIYSDDKSLATWARMCKIKTIRSEDIPLPDGDNQQKFDFDSNV